MRRQYFVRVPLDLLDRRTCSHLVGPERTRLLALEKGDTLVHTGDRLAQFRTGSLVTSMTASPMLVNSLVNNRMITVIR